MLEEIPENFAILGPCVIENEDHVLMMAKKVRDAAVGSIFTPVFKASFEKANRSSISSFTGLGIDQGLKILGLVKAEFGLPITTDVHESNQVQKVAEVADILQVPAFLCRQSALLQACAETQRVVNVKKAQFMSGYEMANVVEKLLHFGAKNIILTERGTMFGYNNLVVDFKNIVIMKNLGVRVCMDATHSVQLPGALGGSSGGQRMFAPLMARMAAVAGADGYFLETHNDPDNAPSDGPNMIPVEHLGRLLKQLSQIHEWRDSIEKLPFESV